MQIGIVGLPNVGKSSLFNALTKAQVPAENFPFTTIQPNVGVVPVPDPRLDFLAQAFKSPKVVPASVQFVDIAGLVPGASKGEGLGNQFLSHIREVDAIAHVLRAFESEEVVNVLGEVDPLRDEDVISAELLLADIDQAQRIKEKLGGNARSGDETARKKIAALETLLTEMNEGIPVRKSKTDLQLTQEYNFLSAKPALYVANTNEQTPPERLEKLEAWARKQGASIVKVNVKLELEVVSLPDEEQEAYRKELGVTESGLGALARAGQELLELTTFFTAGPKESHAWQVQAGAPVPVAAGKIHSDMERGFIRAEVYSFDDFKAVKSEAALKAAGKMRMEGRDYLVRDGDVVYVHFKV